MTRGEAKALLAGVNPTLPVYKTYGGALLPCTTMHTTRRGAYRLLHAQPEPLTVQTFIETLGHGAGPLLSWGPDSPEPLWAVIGIEVGHEAVIIRLEGNDLRQVEAVGRSMGLGAAPGDDDDYCDDPECQADNREH